MRITKAEEILVFGMVILLGLWGLLSIIFDW